MFTSSGIFRLHSSFLQAVLHLTKLVVTQMELLQSGPFVDWPTQIQAFDAVLTEHYLPDVM